LYAVLKNTKWDKDKHLENLYDKKGVYSHDDDGEID